MMYPRGDQIIAAYCGNEMNGSSMMYYYPQLSNIMQASPLTKQSHSTFLLGNQSHADGSELRRSLKLGCCELKKTWTANRGTKIPTNLSTVAAKAPDFLQPHQPL